MKIRCATFLFAGLLLHGASAAENFDEALVRARVDYSNRLKQAGEDLNRTRTRIAAEKRPLLEALRATEDGVIALERETIRLTTTQTNAAAERRRLLHDIEGQRKTGAYVTTVAADALKLVQSGLLPGEDALIGDRLQDLQTRLDTATKTGDSGPVAAEVAEFMLARTEQMLGGRLASGSALNVADSRLQQGTLAFAGPEVFFAPQGGGPAGMVRLREGSRRPVYYPQATWSGTESAAFFMGKIGAMPADPTGGKALRLQQTSGTVWEYVGRGGKVAYVIVGVGFIALLLIIHKFMDIAAMRVDTTGRVEAFLRAVAEGRRAEAEAALPQVARTTRELFEAGLRHVDAPPAVLEEKLEAVLLGQRLHFERRLSLLAVIATAAPLMGLLGTVVGMVKTFTLITVYGTGNAGKLSGGISEVLVATELGLAVAIPALVVHGFLTHRINKNLAVLERQALEFGSAAGGARRELTAAEEMA